MDIKRLEKTLNEINGFGDEGVGINRLAYSEEERAVKEFFAELCRKEGLDVREDPAGNIIARRGGENPSLPAVAFGSHLDTVYEGGKYDGALGVVSALEVIRSLNDRGIKTEHPLEIISFAGEESARFGFSTIGSKAMSGTLGLEYEELKDRDGVFLSEELLKYSLNLEGAERSGDDFAVFFEIHIEQGPVLEKQGKQLGIVTGIAGATRFHLTVQGQASHSGTTPMGYRKDAFLGAAEISLALESAAVEEQHYGTVATVGVCEVKPGAMNIVPGLAELKVDIRGISKESKDRVIEKMTFAIAEAEKKRGLAVSVVKTADELPVTLSAEVITSLKDSADKLQYSYELLPSGAGHDAMNMARLCPTGMIFIPSKEGLSHNPEEYSALEDIGAGAQLLEEEIIKWAKVVHEAKR
ncbi:M20 family metallo-hydrolase [Planomicrobium sp. YIM 101495]|uniref:M20 family metallo-hydrolase n=1 Tax=Planomicrobium sp. YIM 101495 TaxID=2665160 RepID=UPI0012B9DDC6|nr:M20 family metallo-hydrolase [Planomicrobium sp. YIM 101495]MTD30706.1 hydantoinase/carbamoylase family amidase [Planomicrobium sp. YIM 101495]